MALLGIRRAAQGLADHDCRQVLYGFGHGEFAVNPSAIVWILGMTDDITVTAQIARSERPARCS